jgi:O-antigen biosynthesis protein
VKAPRLPVAVVDEPDWQTSPRPGQRRPRVRGKFLHVRDAKLYVRGVTYGTFRPDADGHQFPQAEVVEHDFTQMVANGVNAVRTYTVPPLWLLDAAYRHGLWVMVGVPWEEHVAFLEDTKLAPAIEERVRAGVRSCAGHAAVLCFVIGNEIPASIVAWHGRRRVERFLKRLYWAAKAEDPGALVTYMNFPTTEYLELPFLDLLCFNVYLESRERLDAYLARLQNLAGERPLVLGELGLDSLRQGEDTQAEILAEQIRTTFAAGCAGVFVYAWTDEWYRSGVEIEDWAFGLTTRDRRPKLALAAVRETFAEVPFPSDLSWPPISVVVCSYNGARTIRDCFEALLRLEYPSVVGLPGTGGSLATCTAGVEVIVVDDGSTDATASIAREYGFRVISTENRGLSSARNTGLQAVTGEIVAYIDDDAYPDPHWLMYLAFTFMTSSYVAVGGPNLAPPGDGRIADCVANAPGGPIHVLLSDREAEHIPGCNMAFRKVALQAIGGFDTQFRVAGDDVDVCWRLQERGGTLGFHSAALVWHHRRNSVRTYWKQQRGYGKAEALLETKWPDKYNAVGHVSWGGRVYGKGVMPALMLGSGRIYRGTWGSAPFQSLYQPAAGMLSSLTLMPEWYLAVAALGMLGALGVVWRPLLFVLPLLALALGASIAQALLGARRASFMTQIGSRRERLSLQALTTCLYLMQPLARLYGRMRHGLTLWRTRARQQVRVPRPITSWIWSETWRDPVERLRAIEVALQFAGAQVRRGGDFHDWDLEVQAGLFGHARLLMAVEEHGSGRQLVRLRAWPKWHSDGVWFLLLLAVVSSTAALDQAWVACTVLGAAAAVLGLRMLQDAGAALAIILACAGFQRRDAAQHTVTRVVRLFRRDRARELVG